MIDWSRGFSASYYMSVMDSALWRDIDRVEILSGTVARSADSLRTSADVTCRNWMPDRETWVRVWLEAHQGNDAEKVPLFTGLAVAPTSNINGMRTEYPLQCYSVLKPAQDVLLERGWYAPVSMSGATLIQRLLAVCPAPIVVEDNSPSLANAIIAESGETHLTMVDKILDAINWRMRIDGDGTIRIGERASVPSGTFDALDNDILEPQVTLSHDWFKCPNVFRAIQEDTVAVARDDDEDSFLSTINRGREVWMEEDGCDLNTGETIAEYALRRLREEQSVATDISYVRRFRPDITVTDIVTLHYPAQNLQGDYLVKSQSITLGHGCKVSEEVRK